MNPTQAMLRGLIRELILEVLQEQQRDHPAGESSTHSASPMEKPVKKMTLIDKGALTERLIATLAQDGIDTVRVAKRVVVTPLARDKARALNINIERVC